jgi:phage baseplate assembly protein W
MKYLQVKSFNIKFPIRDNTETNSLFLMSQVTKDAFSSNLFLLLITEKGERYYEPDYGTNLLKYIFEPNDNLTSSDIEQEIKSTVSLYIPNLTVNRVTFNRSTDSDNLPVDETHLLVEVGFTYSENAFSEEGTISLNF